MMVLIRRLSLILPVLRHPLHLVLVQRWVALKIPLVRKIQQLAVAPVVWAVLVMARVALLVRVARLAVIQVRAVRPAVIQVRAVRLAVIQVRAVRPAVIQVRAVRPVAVQVLVLAMVLFHLTKRLLLILLARRVQILSHVQLWTL
jgi:hypothetical protein